MRSLTSLLRVGLLLPLILVVGRVAGAPAPSPALVQPSGLAVEADGSLLITDIGAHRLFRLSPSGKLTVFAGTGEGGFLGDEKPAAGARLHAPHDVALAADGAILVADTYNHRVRRIERSGIIRTIAGGVGGKYAGDGGLAIKASLNNPQGIAVGPDGALYIADTYNHVVRRVDAKGIITTFAGTEPGLAGDGGPAVKAQLSLPTSVAVASDGTVYISEAGNNRIRRVKPDRIVETVLGTGPGSGTAGAGFGGDGGPALQAKVFAPADLALDPQGGLLLSDSGNHRVRLISNGVIRTVAGTGTPGARGDDGPALNAELNTPQKIAVGPDGALYVAEPANRRVRKVGADGRIQTVTPRP
jgi:sugar lactone lactonase YvrE